MTGCLSIIGFFTSAVSLMIVFGAITDLITGAYTNPSTLWMTLVFFSLTSAGSSYLTVNSIRTKRTKEKEKKEREILKIAARKGGRITPVEIAADSELSLEEAKKLIEDMCKRGFAELDLTNSGELVYLVKGVVSSSEKLISQHPES